MSRSMNFNKISCALPFWIVWKNMRNTSNKIVKNKWRRLRGRIRRGVISKKLRRLGNNLKEFMWVGFRAREPFNQSTLFFYVTVFSTLITFSFKTSHVKETNISSAITTSQPTNSRTPLSLKSLSIVDHLRRLFYQTFPTMNSVPKTTSHQTCFRSAAGSCRTYT